MSYVSHVAGENRVFDPIYDSLFIVASRKDAWRANTTALSKSAPIHVLSNYHFMFSDLPKESRSIYWRQENLLPHFRLGGGGDAAAQHGGDISKQTSKADLLGKYRGCYFQHLSGDSAIVNLKLDLPENYDDVKEDETPQEKIKTVGCQTVYRESSAQTRPYQPEAIIAPGEDGEPEVLRISKLITGDNQPGEFETKIVERARRRRQWEKELPPLNSEKDSKSRAVVLEAFEWEEWLSREEEIEDVQSMRLELVVRLLERRNQCYKLKSIAKIENSAKRIQEKRSHELQKLQHSHDRELRKLETKHKKISKKYKKSNIVDEHIDHGSELYGPQMRFGVNPNRRHYVGFRKKFCARLEKLDKQIKERETSLICPISKYNQLAKPKDIEISQCFCAEAKLNVLYESLKSLRAKNPQKGVPKCLKPKGVNVEKIPETPIGVECDKLAESNYQAAVYLQKIIKGRAVQNVLYRGKQIYKGLIDELKSTKLIPALSALYPKEAENIVQRKIAAHKQHKQLQQIFKSENEIKEVLSESEAAIIGSLLEFLEKELKRLYEQRKVHALYMLAEKERKKRESFEAGKRQRENRRREEHEEIYKTLTKSTRDTATIYLENVLIEETNIKAEKDARLKIEAMARRLDYEASKKGNEDDRLKRRTTEGEENVINEIVNNFVFPEVQKRLAQKRMELRQRRYLLAAHRELYSHVENIFPKDINLEEQPQIADEILIELINKAVDSEDALTELCPEENVAHHEAMAAIRKIIKTVLPGKKKWKSSAERIVSATISELTHMVTANTKNEEPVIESSTLTCPMLSNVIADAKCVLWKEVTKSPDMESFVTVHQVRPTISVIPENYNLKTKRFTPPARFPLIRGRTSSEITIHKNIFDVIPNPKKVKKLSKEI